MRLGVEANVRAAASGVVSVKIVFWVDPFLGSEKSACVKDEINNPQKKKKSVIASIQILDNDAVEIDLRYVFCALCNQKWFKKACLGRFFYK